MAGADVLFLFVLRGGVALNRNGTFNGSSGGETVRLAPGDAVTLPRGAADAVAADGPGYPGEPGTEILAVALFPTAGTADAGTATSRL